MAAYYIKVNDELWQQFKMLCVMEKVTIKKKLEEVIKEQVERAKRRYSK